MTTERREWSNFDKFDEAVEFVAREMCRELKVGEDDYTTVPIVKTMTPYEHSGEVRAEVPTVHWPSDGPPYRVDSGVVDQHTATVPRWRAFRRDAAIALASWRAVHKFVLTQT